jgi:Domain of unknown function (DUF3291)
MGESMPRGRGGRSCSYHCPSTLRDLLRFELQRAKLVGMIGSQQGAQTMIQPPQTHLAQLNVARALDDLESPLLADFMAALDLVNAVAERSPGFVWRLKGDGGNATDVRTGEDPRLIVNLSVWETPGHLEHFVWNTVHARVYEKKARWFEPMPAPHLVLWWIPVGHHPTLDEAMQRLGHLTTHGDSDDAFGWKRLPNARLWMERRCA